MGFLSNQWLLANPVRRRKHRPIEVSINAQIPQENWSPESNIVIEINAYRPNGTFQALELTQAEADEILGYVANAASPSARRRVVFKTLSELELSELTEWLALTLNVVSHKRGKKLAQLLTEMGGYIRRYAPAASELPKQKRARRKSGRAKRKT